MTIRGRVLLPVSLVNLSGGAIVSNNGGNLVAQGGGLISNNGGGLVAQGGGLVSNNGGGLSGSGSGGVRQLQGLFRLLGIEEQPVIGISVVLTDARGNVFRRLPTVLSDQSGAFEIQQVPLGMTYTVQAGLQTPKGEIRVASLVASEKPVTVSIASTLLVEELRRVVDEQWGSLNQSTFERVAMSVAHALEPEDAQLAFTATMSERQKQVFQRIKALRPELVADLDSLVIQIRQVSQASQAIAAELRRSLDFASNPPPAPSAALTQPPTDAPSESPIPTPAPSAAITELPTSVPSTTTEPSLSPESSPSPRRFVVTTLAGSGEGYADGAGTAAQFRRPSGMAVDGAGNVYVADKNNHRIRKISPAGVVITLAGSEMGYTDGTGTAAQFKYPSDVAVDGSGNVYVADNQNHRIRKISPSGVVTTLAGSGYGYADGTGGAARFRAPSGVAVDGAGNVYVTDIENVRIRKISPSGVVTTLAGSEKGYADGAGTEARFEYPYGVAVDDSGNLYVTDTHRIRQVSPSGVVITLAGSGVAGYADGTGGAARFRAPSGVATDSDGNVYVADSSNHSVRKISPAGVVTTLAGSDDRGQLDNTGTPTEFYLPKSVAVDGAGNVYVADGRIHKIVLSP